MNRVIVEFAGISGIGKSTLAKEVIRLLKNEKINTTDDSFKKSINFSSVLSLVRVFRVVLLLKPNSIRSFIKLFKHIGVREVFLKQNRQKKGFQIFDEGLFKIANFAINDFSHIKDANNFLEICFKYLEKPTVLIILEADAKTILERRKERNKKYEELDYESIVMSQDKQRLNTAIEKYKDNINILVIKHNTKEDLSINAKKIVRV